MTSDRQAGTTALGWFSPLPFGGLREELTEGLSQQSTSFWGESWRRLRRNRGAMAGFAVILVVVVLSVVGPYLVPYAPSTQHIGQAFQGPSAAHWLGTDEFGRDQWARIWIGTRVSLYVGLLATAIDLGVGVAYGAISGYLGGKIDTAMQRVVEVVVGVPHIVVLILMLTVLSPGILTISIALGIVGWVGMAILVRGQVLKIKEEEHFLAAQALGAGGPRLMLRHLIPHVTGIMIIQLMFTIPYAIFFEAFLSFIGLGIQPPTPSIGSLIESGFANMQYYPYLLWPPIAVLSLLMISFNLLADGVRDALDVQMRR